VAVRERHPIVLTPRFVRTLLTPNLGQAFQLSTSEPTTTRHRVGVCVCVRPTSRKPPRPRPLLRLITRRAPRQRGRARRHASGAWCSSGSSSRCCNSHYYDCCARTRRDVATRPRPRLRWCAPGECVRASERVCVFY